MPAPNSAQNVQTLPLTMVGGNKFGRFQKISDEQTYNFIVSDTALVPYAGYKRVIDLVPTAKGRAIYTSTRGNIMIAVLGTEVYSINASLQATLISGTLASTQGDVFIAENNNKEIAITDGSYIYVYNWGTGGALVRADSVAGFPASLTHPGYISFQNGRLIVANTDSTNWYLSGANNALLWDYAPATTNHGYVGALQSKPDTCQAAVPMPGAGNVLLLFGHTVIEQWQDIGASLFPYQRASTFSVDYGTLNASSIAALDNYVVWLSANEQAGATVMIISGHEKKSISTDGIDFKLANLTNPSNCTGFLFRQDGHVIYQFTFPDDNLSYALDLKTGLFSTVTDENLNYHIARDVVYFNNKYYFVSLNGGSVYEISSDYYNADYGDGNVQEIPRYRITSPFRLVSQRYFIMLNAGFTIEMGEPNIKTVIPIYEFEVDSLTTEDSDILTTEGGLEIGNEGEDVEVSSRTLYSESIDLSVSRDGGVSFGNAQRMYLNPTGVRKNRLIWQRLGQANDATLMFRFNGFGRFVVFDGEVNTYE